MTPKRQLINLPTASFSTISNLLTLFSKFFSSFLRSTCSLSVSHQYLALEEVYLPIRAAVPNNPTLGLILTPRPRQLRGFHPLWRPVPRNLFEIYDFRNSLQTTIRILYAFDLHSELMPLHSPLLRQSLLVSFPPLTDILKFSG